jgi:hypothetical protein
VDTQTRSVTSSGRRCQTASRKAAPDMPWSLSVQVGDLIKYNPLKLPPPISTGIILYINVDGGTVKVVDQTGEIRWMVQSGCEVINASR